jgi:hypothetical protein
VPGGRPSAEPGGGCAAGPRSGAAWMEHRRRPRRYVASGRSSITCWAMRLSWRSFSANSLDRVKWKPPKVAELLSPDQVAPPLAARPYDLRHAAVSLWLNGGVAATDVANRAGHSVEVLLRVYAKCIDGGEKAANRRIDEALAP